MPLPPSAVKDISTGKAPGDLLCFTLLKVSYYSYPWSEIFSYIDCIVILQLRIYAMYNKKKWLTRLNLTLFLIEIVAMLAVYNIGIHSGISLYWHPPPATV